jgi:predicted NBD/HSP70 family sugar kinase
VNDTFAVGLDLGATKTLGVVIDAAGVVVAEERATTRPGPEGVVATAVQVVEALRRSTGEALPGTVGVGLPGLVDAERGNVKHAVNLGVDGAWLPFGALLSSRIGVPVTVENDVNAAALGAMALSGADDLVYLSVGTGLAAGLVLGGRLRRGDHGAAGEIGHVPVDPRGASCQCGQRGCLETVASGSALAAAWPSDDPSPARAVFAAAERGDERAVAVRDRFAAGLAEAVRLLTLTVDPRSIVIGGGVAQVGEPLRLAVASALAAQAASSPFLSSLDLAERLRVVPAGHPVAAVGAALLGRPGRPR